MSRHKRILGLFAASVIMLSAVFALPPAASASDADIAATGWIDPANPDFVYEDADDQTVSIYKYIGIEKTVSIPSELDGCTVVSIGSEAFADNTEITEVVIPDTVTVIGERAFFGCTAIMSVDIPDTVTQIGEKAFGYIGAEDGGAEKLAGFTVRGSSGSEAERYAVDNGFAFISSKGLVVTVKSYLSETDEVTAELIRGGEVLFSEKASGLSAVFGFNDAEGEYTLRLSKNNHTARECEVSVEDGAEIDAEINPVGDVNGDGKTTQTDYVTAMAYVRKTKTDLDDYKIKCGDVFGSGDGFLTAQDANRIVQHTRKVKLLY